LEQHGWSPRTCGKVLISRESNCTWNDFILALDLGLGLLDVDVFRMLRMGLVAVISIVSVSVPTFIFDPVDCCSDWALDRVLPVLVVPPLCCGGAKEHMDCL